MARVIKRKNGDYVIINDLFEEIPIKSVDVLYPFHNNIATFRVTQNKKKMFGYMNVQGERITNDVYEHAEDFGPKYGLVKKGDYQNLIDRNGNELFAWKYTKIAPFLKDTFICLNKEGYYGLVDKNDKIILGFIYETQLSITHDARRLIVKWPIFDRSFYLTSYPSRDKFHFRKFAF